jgi:hypothetical protein
MANDSDTGSRPKGRSCGRRAGLVVIAAFIFLATLELVFRFAGLRPRFVTIRPSKTTALETIHGIPVWRTWGTKERRNEACMEKNRSALALAFFGSSIFYGAELPPGEVFTALLQKKFDERFGAGRVCVLNYAEPAFTASGKWALARDLLPRFRDAIVVWEAWETDPYTYVILGNSAYMLRSARVNARGYPDAFRLPPALNDFLFRHSRAYQYADLAFVPTPPEPAAKELIQARVVPILNELLGLVRRRGDELMLVPAPELSRPFRDQIADGEYSVERGWAASEGVEVESLAKVLSDQDPAKIRLDPCCHYNATGHRVIADRMFALLLPKVSTRLAQR